MPWKHHILYFPTHSGHFATTKGKIKRNEYKSPPTPSIFPLLTVTTSQLPLPMLQINTHHLTQPYKDPLAVPITPGKHSHWNLLIRQLTKRHLALNIRLKSIISLHLKQEEDSFDFLWQVNLKNPSEAAWWFPMQDPVSHSCGKEGREEAQQHPPRRTISKRCLRGLMEIRYLCGGLNYWAKQGRITGTWESSSTWTSHELDRSRTQNTYPPLF